ncbi:MAG: DUF1579 domain-containing protein [Melioribacteraceae bacterium]|nr:DUF1579 domain-containing protein [Melioribacteraceae bacterium]MCF8356781.1 DUF1579 domain-containing protein [Melioribacteraceae bacterium]MCF8396153.1 DUF1579 domain-containing protein [Melioribacteraceae bacterium]MCF8421109.1 DUF1579 domain-containing protein [Melioribacteraceae bacterium]
MDNKYKLILILILILSSIFTTRFSAQISNSNCSDPNAHQFDFWIGSWDLTWTDSEGNLQHGSNTIEYLFDGCVIQENFNGMPSISLVGKSWSVFNSKTKKWRQTWVDNNGGYLDFTGGMIDDKMILSRTINGDSGKEMQQRMVWYNISENELMWNWEKSFDKGKTWKTMWKINYKRITK